MVQFSTEAANPHDWPSWLPRPAAQQLAELECDHSPGSAFRKKILYSCSGRLGLPAVLLRGLVLIQELVCLKGHLWRPVGDWMWKVEQ